MVALRFAGSFPERTRDALLGKNCNSGRTTVDFHLELWDLVTRRNRKWRRVSPRLRVKTGSLSYGQFVGYGLHAHGLQGVFPPLNT